VRHLKFFFINTLKELHLKIGNKAGHGEFANYLNKDLTYADALAAQKREITVRISVFTAWSQEIRTLRVESIRNEFFRLLPLCGVVL